MHGNGIGSSVKQRTPSILAMCVLLAGCTQGTTQPARFLARLSPAWAASERTFISQHGSNGADLPTLDVQTSSGHKVFSKAIGLRGVAATLAAGSYVLTLLPPAGFIGI